METTADIFEEFGVAVPRFGEKAVPAATSAQREPLLEYIDYVPTPIDHIVKRSGLTATTVSSMLIRLELQRRVQCGAGGYLRAPEPLQQRPDELTEMWITVHYALLCGMTSPAAK